MIKCGIPTDDLLPDKEEFHDIDEQSPIDESCVEESHTQAPTFFGAVRKRIKTLKSHIQEHPTEYTIAGIVVVGGSASIVTAIKVATSRTQKNSVPSPLNPTSPDSKPEPLAPDPTPTIEPKSDPTPPTPPIDPRSITGNTETPVPAPQPPSADAPNLTTPQIISPETIALSRDEYLVLREKVLSAMIKGKNNSQRIDISLDTFKSLIDAFFKQELEQLKKSIHINNFDVQALGDGKFIPFVRKIVIPTDSKITQHGDFHGDAASLIQIIDEANEANDMSGLQIINPKFYLGFFGDYVDRGNCGIEVIQLIMQLKLANPHNIIMCRGNHETYSISARYGFLSELQHRFNLEPETANLLLQEINQKLYNLLPAIILVGSENELFHCSHGGIDFGWNPQPLLATDAHDACENIAVLESRKNYNCCKPSGGPALEDHEHCEQYVLDREELSDPSYLRSLWTIHATSPEDCATTEHYLPGYMNYGRPIQGPELTKGFFNNQCLMQCNSMVRRIVKIIRAHQHDIYSQCPVGQHCFAPDNSTPGVCKNYVEPTADIRDPRNHILTLPVAPHVGYKYPRNGMMTVQLDPRGYQYWNFDCRALEPIKLPQLVQN